MPYKVDEEQESCALFLTLTFYFPVIEGETTVSPLKMFNDASLSVLLHYILEPESF